MFKRALLIFASVTVILSSSCKSENVTSSDTSAAVQEKNGNGKCESTKGSPTLRDTQDTVNAFRNAGKADEMMWVADPILGGLKKCRTFRTGPNNTKLIMCEDPKTGNFYQFKRSAIANVFQSIIDLCKTKDRIDGFYRVGGFREQDMKIVDQYNQNSNLFNHVKFTISH